MATSIDKAEGGAVLDVHDNSEWMTNLPSDLVAIPLNTLAIPGSHNSFAFYLDKAGPLSPDAEPAIRNMIKVSGNRGKKFIYRWGITQNLSFTKQLKAGVRYFDLRVVTKPETEDLYFAHTLYSYKIEDSMKEINKFLDDHPKEVILLDFNHFYGMTEVLHKQFLSMLLEIFGSKMCHFQDTKSVTLGKLWESNLQVIIFYNKNDIVTVKDPQYSKFWPGSKIRSPWPKKTDVRQLISFLDKNMKTGRPEDSFYVSQGVLTPSGTFVVFHFYSSLKDALSVKVVSPFVSWLKKQHIGGKNGVNIFIMDFCDLGNYINSVIELNHM